MAKRQRRQQPLKPQSGLSPAEHVGRLLTLVRPSLETIMGMIAQGRPGAALEITFMYGCAQGIRIARQDMRSAKQIEKGVDELLGGLQVEVNVEGKTQEEAQEEVKKATTKGQRPAIWTPGGEV